MSKFKLNPFTGKLDLVGSITTSTGTIGSAQIAVTSGSQTITLASCTPAITMLTGNYEVVGYVDNGSGTQGLVGISDKTYTQFTLNSPFAGTFYFVIG